MSASLFMQTDRLRMHYRIDGNDDAPWLMMSNSLGTDLRMWEPQMQVLSQHFRVLRYDARGHGLSSMPTIPALLSAGPACSIADLSGDAIALLDFLGIEQVHFCGLSLGGMIGMWLGVNHPARLTRLALCNTAPRMAPPAVWDARIAQVNRGGLASIATNVIQRWLTLDFQARSPADVAIVREMLLNTSAAGYNAGCEAIRDMDQIESLSAMRTPTLVIVGTRDIATPPLDGQLIASRIPGAGYVELDAAHLSNWEQAVPFAENLINFLR